METYIEKRFAEISKDTRNELLYNQWKLDKLQVSKILQRIKDFFPHYTNHDSSHSEVILDNIYLLLGENGINNLSSTDLWLLLQVAYFHDIGMIVDNQTFEYTLKSSEFIEYLNYIKKTPNHALYNHSKILTISDNKIEFIDKEISVEKFSYIKYLISDFLRKFHGDRIVATVKNTFKEEFTHRDGSIIPRRLYELVYRISMVHTKNFDEIFSLILKENGFSIDKCHPRLIASLLRLGDLLDLDSNRYDNFMDKLQKDMPSDSLDHILKHRLIENFNIDNKSITVVSRVHTYEVYDITSKWFSWIKEEIGNQQLNWHNIVTENLDISIPLIDRLEVLIEDYSLLPTGEVPHFYLPSEKAMEVVQGSQIYSDKSNYFREIIQNSLDSTYIKVWSESKKKNNTDELFPKDRLPTNNFDDFEISIDVEYNEEGTIKKSDGNNYYKIVIRDKGVGMSVNEIKYLLNIGTSQENRHKEKIIEEMPNYLKPSGNFGIGFQSIFNITDKVIIKSKSYFTSEEIELVLDNPVKTNNVLYKHKIDKSNKDSYFKLSFDYAVKQMANKYKGFGRDEEKKYNFMMNYDMIKSYSFDLDIFEIYKIVNDICKEILLVPIKFKFKGKEEKIISDLKNKYLLSDGKSIISIYSGNGNTEFYFKGQKLKDFLFGVDGFYFDINLIGYSASEILTYSRNEIMKDKKEKIYREIFENLSVFIKEEFWLDKLDELNEKRKKQEEIEKGKFSLYVLLVEYDESYVEKILNFEFEKLRGCSDEINSWIYNNKEKNITNYKTLIEKINKSELIEVSNNFMKNIENKYDFYWGKEIVYQFENKIRNILIGEILKTHSYIYPPNEDGIFGNLFSLNNKFYKEKNTELENNYYKKSIELLNGNLRPPYNRYVWYALDDYKNLVIDKNEFKNIWVCKPMYFKSKLDFIFMPILFKEYSESEILGKREYSIDEIDDDFINFIKPKLANKDISNEDIKNLYEKLVKELKN